MVALFLVCYFLLTIVLGWKINKLKSELIKASEELKKCVEEKHAMGRLVAKKKASKKRGKAKAEALEALIKGKEQLIRLLEEQLAIAQSTDRGLREANIRLANQVVEANAIITELRGELRGEW
jgi:hypothetical protein